MNHHTSKPKILCISGKDYEKCFRDETIFKTKYEIIEANTSESGIHKALEYNPDLIICQFDMDGFNGFQIYNILKASLIKNGILFFIFSDKLNREDILIGLEMGIDNFILFPFDEEAVLQKIENQLQKIKKLKFYDSEDFWQAFETTPVPKFIIVNHCITEKNSAFKRLCEGNGIKEHSLKITDVFDFSELENSEINLKKCLSGLKQQCLFESLPLKTNDTLKFDIHLVYSDYFGKDMFLAEVMPEGGMNDTFIFFRNGYNNKDSEPGTMRRSLNGDNGHGNNLQLTAREKEVLEWSSQGLPVKQIAALLTISERTVEKHRANIMAKTGTSSIIEAIYAVQRKYA